MTKEISIEEGNKLIAEFVGMKYLSTHIDSHNYEQYCYSMPDELSKQVYGYTGATCFLSDEQFYTSWDWLRPVVDKIHELRRAGKFKRSDVDGKPADEIFCLYISAKIETAWNAIIQFIIWYNSNQSK